MSHNGLKLDDILSKNFEESLKDYKPKWKDVYWCLSIYNVDFTFWDAYSWGIDLCETFPYSPDGSVPLIFISIGYFHITIDSKRLYKYLYDRKYNEDIMFD